MARVIPSNQKVLKLLPIIFSAIVLNFLIFTLFRFSFNSGSPSNFHQFFDLQSFSVQRPVCAADFLHPFVNILQNNSQRFSPCSWPRPYNKNVFLLETVKNYAIPKILCTVESAARHTKNFCVTLMIVDHDPPKDQMEILQKLVDELPNVEIVSLDPNDLLVDTPFEGFYETERFLKSKESFNAPIHISDIGRANLLWKFGGIYVDLDVIVLKSLDRAPEYVARTPHGGIANGIMKFNAQSAMLTRYLSNIWTDYNPSQYSRLFYVLLETVHNHCLRKNLNIAAEDASIRGRVEECDGVKIFGVNSGLFEPFKTTEAINTIFNETHGEVFESILKKYDPTVLHYAGNSKGHYRTKINIRESDTLFARMFRKHCPLITERYVEV